MPMLQTTPGLGTYEVFNIPEHNTVWKHTGERYEDGWYWCIATPGAYSHHVPFEWGEPQGPFSTAIEAGSNCDLHVEPFIAKVEAGELDDYMTSKRKGFFEPNPETSHCIDCGAAFVPTDADPSCPSCELSR